MSDSIIRPPQNVLPKLKLPRKVELDPRCEGVHKVLGLCLRPLWENSSIQVAQVPLLPNFEKALILALHTRQLEPGLENIDRLLDNEQKGLTALREKQGAAPAHRVSRLLIIANDGSERFYRAVESTLRRHSDRVLILQVDVPSSRLVQKLYGEERAIKALLVSERDGVSQILLSLVGQAIPDSESEHK